MLRIRTGARYGLRWGVFGFVAAIVTIPSSPTQAAPYADIVVDANTGTVLHSTNPDAQRHPASLTKIMTLYLLFEQLEAGKLKLDSQLKVSAEAAEQNPTKLGLKPGSTLAVEDAIKGMVTRSANDAAVVVAEAIAGDEREFAKLMTRKAQALGMSRTVYKNASGLPDNDQVTTARDQSTLGRAVQERFPRYYKYFSIRTFTFRGQSISNHNRLLGKVEGVDGIKTGYINASGFNLVTSVHRGNRYLVAVVMGGSSGASRDARMRDLVNDKIAQASTKRTTSMFAEASETPESKPEPKVAAKPEPKPESKSEPKVASKAEAKAETKVAETKVEPKVEAKAETKPETKPEPKAEAKAKGESRFAVASAISVPVRFGPPGSQAEPAVARMEPAAARVEPAAAAAPSPSRIAAGSTDPIRPVLVKTLTVRAGAQIAAVAPLNNPSSAAAEMQPIRVAAAPVAPAAPVVTTVAAAKPEAPAQPAAVPAAKPEQPTPAPAAAAKPDVTAPASAPAAIAKSEPQAPAPAPVTIAKSEPPAPAAVAKPEPAAPAPAPVATTKPEQPTPLPTARPATPPARTASADPARTPPAAKPQHRSGWIIQVGAYPAERAAKERLTSVQSKASKMLTGAEAFTETIEKGGTTYYRARFAGLDKDKAEAACKYLKKNDVECVTIKN
jgi:D-alanyl-D-alanine carboxypeptidase